jgi:hypothetical protein
MKYAIFTPATGQILRMVDCPETMIEAQLGVGEAATPAGQDISDATHYVMGGFQPMPAPPSPHHEWDWATKQWHEPADMEPARAAKWSQIKAARDADENGGFDTAWGRFDSDPASQTKLIGAAQLASIALAQGAPFGIEWTLQDNTSVPLDANQMISVGVALAAHIDAAHQRGRQLRAQIEAATTLQDLESITWTP